MLAAQSGWAWAPGDRYEQDGQPHAQDSRLLLQRLVDDWAERGVTFRSAYEIEWVVSAGDGDDFLPAAIGPAYGLGRLAAASDYGRDLLEAFAAQGIRVEQLHPEYAPGQFEVSVAAESPVHAADTSVLVRATIRAVGLHYGFRTSFSPKVDAAGVGNGGHLHISPWRDGANLMAGGSGRYGMTRRRRVVRRWRAGAPAGAPRAGGAERRVVPAAGAAALGRRVCVLGAGEPGGRAAAGHRFDGERGVVGEPRGQVRRPAREPVPPAGRRPRRRRGRDAAARTVDVDPAALEDDELARRGVVRLPTTLRESLDAFLGDQVLGEAFGAPLVESIAAVRESELEELGSSSPEQVADASRWAH